jgi:hypothetical protein
MKQLLHFRNNNKEESRYDFQVSAVYELLWACNAHNLLQECVRIHRLLLPPSLFLICVQPIKFLV